MPSTFRDGSFYLPSVLVTLAALATAQEDRVTQDIANISVYPSQKPCAHSCFQRTGFCPKDVLGRELGCVTATDCKDYGWEAPNDCYCRADFQNIALGYLSSCVSKSCSLGNVGIDASSAGSIYSQYCSQKGFTAALPASVLATTTGTGGQTKTRTSGGESEPANPSVSGQDESPTRSNSLSLTSIIGIGIGSLVGLILLAYLLKKLRTHFSKKPNYPQQPPVSGPQPVYPMNPYYSPHYPSPKFEAELSPNDSASMLSSPVRPAPTLISGIGRPAGRR